MQVRYERPMPDLTFMVRAPLRLVLSRGQVATIDEWSMDGIRAPAELNGDNGEATLVIPFQGFEISFNVVLQRDPDTGLMRFVDLGPREGRVLRHFYRELVTGRAVPIEHVITAMDTPVDKVPMSETPVEEARSRANTTPRLIRAGLAIGLYAVLIAGLHQPVIEPIWQQASAMIGGDDARSVVEAPVSISGSRGMPASINAPAPDSSLPL